MTSNGVYVMFAWRCDECAEDSGRWSAMDPPETFTTEADARVAYQQHLIGSWHDAMTHRWCEHHESPGSCPVYGCAHHSTEPQSDVARREVREREAAENRAVFAAATQTSEPESE